ncbi:hypothetical protein WMY93_032142 [Mugilogobius chulae]|uniref:Uncharacterized protein n=1 Tax=Mugilogobius chulae TaxID=88201 RepID=A0AAW0MCK1_9GOBI
METCESPENPARSGPRATRGRKRASSALTTPVGGSDIRDRSNDRFILFKKPRCLPNVSFGNVTTPTTSLATPTPPLAPPTLTAVRSKAWADYDEEDDRRVYEEDPSTLFSDIEPPLSEEENCVSRKASLPSLKPDLTPKPGLTRLKSTLTPPESTLTPPKASLTSLKSTLTPKPALTPKSTLTPPESTLTPPNVSLTSLKSALTFPETSLTPPKACFSFSRLHDLDTLESLRRSVFGWTCGSRDYPDMFFKRDEEQHTWFSWRSKRWFTQPRRRLDKAKQRVVQLLQRQDESGSSGEHQQNFSDLFRDLEKRGIVRTKDGLDVTQESQSGLDEEDVEVLHLVFLGDDQELPEVTQQRLSRYKTLLDEWTRSFYGTKHNVSEWVGDILTEVQEEVQQYMTYLSRVQCVQPCNDPMSQDCSRVSLSHFRNMTKELTLNLDELRRLPQHILYFLKDYDLSTAQFSVGRFHQSSSRNTSRSLSTQNTRKRLRSLLTRTAPETQRRRRRRAKGRRQKLGSYVTHRTDVNLRRSQILS